MKDSSLLSIDRSPYSLQRVQETRFFRRLEKEARSLVYDDEH